MPLLDKLERALGRFAISNLSLYIVIGQVFVVLVSMLNLLDPLSLLYAPNALLAGQWWRAISFLLVVPVPGGWGVIFLVFGWYLFYLMGSALEGQWGAFRFNAFLFLTWALTIALSFFAPRYVVENTFILGSVFIAFAYLYPDFELTLFFILPVKVKWLALLSCVLGAYRFIAEGLPTKLSLGAAVISFLVFFGRDMLGSARYRQKKMARAAERVAAEETPRHVCHVCGKTDLSHPQLDFRYCSKCAGDQCYCPDHIQNHAHVVAADDAKRS